MIRRQGNHPSLADSRLERKRRSHKSGSADQQRLGHRFVQQDAQRGGDPACHFGEFGPRYRHAVALGYAAERFRPDMSDTSGARNSTPVIKSCSQHRLRFYDARHEPRRVRRLSPRGLKRDYFAQKRNILCVCRIAEVRDCRCFKPIEPPIFQPSKRRRSQARLLTSYSPQERGLS